MSQAWDPKAYARDARFVSDLATPVVALLRPQLGERILDLGCGDGVLSLQLGDTGCEVVGVDASPEMIRAARRLGVDARVMNGHELTFDREFDAVFSNAALHWMTRPDDVIFGVLRALKPGGRFVGEFGGHGNVGTVMKALDKALHARGLTAELLNPWYFPTAEEYRARLQTAGFDVHECSLIPRPTRLKNGLVSWLKVFFGSFLTALPESEHAPFFQKVSGDCEAELRDQDGRWSVDYVRLRFAATKPYE